MNNLSLMLITRDSRETEIKLSMSIPQGIDIENIVSETYILSDHEYKIRVIGLNQEYSEAINVRLMINEEPVHSYFAGGLFYHLPEGLPWGYPFSDCYGFVRLSISFSRTKEKPDEIETYSSGLISVLVKKGPVNSLVKDMVRYVSNNYSELITGDLNRPSNIYELHENQEQNLDSQLILADEIARVYEKSLGSFIANPRYKTKLVERVDHIERMQYASARTIQFTIQHPEYLQQSSNGAGIRVGKQFYVPSRTLTGQMEYTEDIYENQIVVSFLRTMIDNIQSLESRVEALLQNIPSEENILEDYVLSSFVVYESTVKTLREDKEKLKILIIKFEQLFESYNRALRVKLIDCSNLPIPTAVFLSVPQYSKIYQCMVQWFTYGNYGFSRESYMLAFIKISSLYEIYTLAKLIQFFKNEGFILNHVYRYVYPRSGNWRYIESKNCNTFCLADEETEITVYYQPVIYNYDSRSYNGIGLYRNTSISIGESNDKDYRGEYYVPDFIIKYVKNNAEYYIIGDAKFSSYNSVLRNYVINLSYKYIVSISPVADNIKIAGLFINYGKEEKTTIAKSIYTNQIEKCPIIPFFEIVPISELTDETHQFAELEKIFNHINNI